jgi:hypothetical protein
MPNNQIAAEKERRAHLAAQGEWSFKAQGLVLDTFGQGLKARYIAGEISFKD